MIRSAFAALSLCALLPAQGFLTSPPGGLVLEGNNYFQGFGAYADARYQLADGMLTGIQPHALAQIQFRLDHRNHTSATAMGRTWTRATLDISETTNFSSFSRTFAANITSTPTRVFDGKRGWPTMTGFPKNKPDDWGGTSGRLSFPFAKPWIYTGKTPILMDYVFRGGTLDNQAPSWASTTGAHYVLDSDRLEHTVGLAAVDSLPQKLIPCYDPSVPLALEPAMTRAHGYVHGPDSPTLTLRNKLQLVHYSYSTAPNAPVIHAIGMGGFDPGVNIGARCNRLYVDFTKPVVVVNLRPTDALLGSSAPMEWFLPWDKAFAGLKLYFQAAWADSKTKALSLTSAARLTIPIALPPSGPPRYRFVESAVPHYIAALSVVGTGPLPFTRYATR